MESPRAVARELDTAVTTLGGTCYRHLVVWGHVVETLHGGGPLFRGASEFDTGKRIKNWVESTKGLEVLVRTVPKQWQSTIRAALQTKPDCRTLTCGQHCASQAGMTASEIAGLSPGGSGKRQEGLTDDSAV